MTRNLLFVCSQNRGRSPTAELVFASHDDVETASAGLTKDSPTPLNEYLLEWAHIVFVMERSNLDPLKRQFGAHLKGKEVVVLDVPDRYTYMDPELIQLLEERVLPKLNKS